MHIPPHLWLIWMVMDIWTSLLELDMACFMLSTTVVSYYLVILMIGSISSCCGLFSYTLCISNSQIIAFSTRIMLFIDVVTKGDALW